MGTDFGTKGVVGLETSPLCSYGSLIRSHPSLLMKFIMLASTIRLLYLITSKVSWASERGSFTNLENPSIICLHELYV